MLCCYAKKKLLSTTLILIIVLITPSFLFATEIRPSKETILQKFKRLRIPFIENQAQANKNVRFYTQTFGGTVFITKNGKIVYSLPKIELLNTGNIGAKGSEGLLKRYTKGRTITKRIVVKEEFIGAKVTHITGEGILPTRVSSFRGKDSSQWRSNIPTYDTINLGEVYKGIEVKLKAYGNNMEKLLYVKPGTDPEVIRLKLSGAQCLKINKAGELEAIIEHGAVKFTKPIAYQEIDGKRVEIPVSYNLITGNINIPYLEYKTQCSELVYGFTLAMYDHTRELVIDPLLASTYLGGNGYDTTAAIAIDSSGNVYVAGETTSSDFPTTSGAYDITYNDDRGATDVFIAKLDAHLTALLSSTYLGGGSIYFGDSASAITIDTMGNVYVAGATDSSDFPTTDRAYDRTYHGSTTYEGGDAFVSKLNADLTNLLASTYLGGSDRDAVSSIAIDSSGNVYVAGYTNSSDFPVTPNAYDITCNGNTDVFISKFNSSLTSLLASTYLGGSGHDGYGDYGGYPSLSIDTSGNICVSGYTDSANFPTTLDSYDTTYNGAGDVFISKFNSSLTSLLASTYLGGTMDDYAYALAIDVSGNVYVAGKTFSSDFPTSSTAYNRFHHGLYDAFILKLNASLKRLLASTYLGGRENDSVNGISIDTMGKVYVTGFTESDNFPTTPGCYDTTYNGTCSPNCDMYGDNCIIECTPDGFIAKFGSFLSTLQASTYFPGQVNGIAITSSGKVYIAGSTNSPDFPTTPGAYNTTFIGGDVCGKLGCYKYPDAFISTLDPNLSGETVTTTTILGTTTTTADQGTSTTTSVPIHLCPFTQFLESQRDLEIMRSLRDSLFIKSNGHLLISLFYQNSSEVSSILEDNPLLQKRFIELVNDNLFIAEKIISNKKAVVSAGMVLKVLGFLNDLMAVGSQKFQQDIDIVIKSIKDGSLLKGLDIKIE